MGIHVACPNGHHLNVKSFLAGKRGICPECSARFDIPRGENPSAEEPPLAAGATMTAPSVALKVTNSVQTGSVADQVVAVEPGDDATLAVALRPDQQTTAEAPAPPPPTIVWYVRPPRGGQYGPATDDIMRQWVAEGRVPADGYVWRTGWSDWCMVKDVGQQIPGVTISPARNGIAAAPEPESDRSIATSPSDGPTFSSATYVARKRRARRIQVVFAGLLFALVLALAGVLLWVLTRAPTDSPTSNDSRRLLPVANEVALGLEDSFHA